MKTKTWRVTGTVVGSKVIGEFKAPNGKAACKKAWGNAYVSVCHHCADEVSDPEVSELAAECDETGEVYRTDGERDGEAVKRLKAVLERMRERRATMNGRMPPDDMSVPGSHERATRDGALYGFDTAMRMLAEEVARG